MSKFKLNVSLEIEQLDDRGYPLGRGGLGFHDLAEVIKTEQAEPTDA